MYKQCHILLYLHIYSVPSVHKITYVFMYSTCTCFLCLCINFPFANIIHNNYVNLYIHRYCEHCILFIVYFGKLHGFHLCFGFKLTG